MPNQKYFFSKVGLDTYPKCMDQIIREKLELPIGSKIASLLHSAYCFNPEHTSFEEVRTAMNNGIWLANFSFQRKDDPNLYIISDEEIIKNSRLGKLENNFKLPDFFDKENISKNKKIVSILENSYNYSEHGFYEEKDNPDIAMSSKSLAVNNLVKGLFGIEGAKKISEIAKILGGNPHVTSGHSKTIFGPSLITNYIIRRIENHLVILCPYKDTQNDSFGFYCKN